MLRVLRAAARAISRRSRLGATAALILLNLSMRTSALPPDSGPDSGPDSRIDWAAPAGVNYGHAEFRLWQPNAARLVRAVVVLVPGSDEDGRALVEDPHWQAFAVSHDMALVGCYFSDKPHPQMFIEAYANAAHGSGQALVDALAAFGAQAGRPELAAAPLLLWGMSAGGQFNYEFVAWKPERVAGFIVNKGGFYYSALLSPEARQVPGLFFTGGKDLEGRQEAVRGLFAINRRGGALWALIEEPTAAHVLGRSREITETYFNELVPLRLDPLSPPAASELLPLIEETGFIGDPKSFTIQRAGARENGDARTTSWLPTQRAARLWEAASKDQQLPQ